MRLQSSRRVIATDTEWFRDLVRDKANTILAQTFKGQIAIGSIQGSIWRDLTLDDVTLTYQGERIAHMERVWIAYGILSLLHNTIDLTHVDVSGLQLSAKQDEDGQLERDRGVGSEPPAAEAQGGGTSPFRVLIREMSLDRGSVNVTLANGETYALDNAGLGGSVYILKDGLRVEIGQPVGAHHGTAATAGKHFRQSDLPERAFFAGRDHRPGEDRHARLPS